MSGSSRKRREKARRKDRRLNAATREAERVAIARAKFQQARDEFDAAFPGARERFGDGSEVVRMMAATRLSGDTIRYIITDEVPS